MPNEIENLLNPTPITTVRWDLPKSTMDILKGYQAQIKAATGTKPKLEILIAHLVEYVGKETHDNYYNGLAERKQREKELMDGPPHVQRARFVIGRDED